GTIPETLELKSRIPKQVLPTYSSIMQGMYWIPCQQHIHLVEPLQLSQWLSRLLIERFEHRVATVYDLLAQQRGNWEYTCYSWIARSFGFKVNAQAFEQFAHRLPPTVIAKYRNRPLAIEALFFGQAGM